jgi:hypothetical protein
MLSFFLFALSRRYLYSKRPFAPGRKKASAHAERERERALTATTRFQIETHFHGLGGVEKTRPNLLSHKPKCRKREAERFISCMLAFSAVKISTAVVNDRKFQNCQPEIPTICCALLCKVLVSVFCNRPDLFLTLARDVIRFHNIRQLGHKLNATFLVL